MAEPIRILVTVQLSSPDLQFIQTSPNLRYYDAWMCSSCTNSRAKGFLMKEFPSDPKRRELWAAAIHRTDLKQPNRRTLCEIHFDKDAWEKVRVDGKRKLKISAVPTLAIQALGNKQLKHRAKRRTELKHASSVVNKTIFQSPAQTSDVKLDNCIKLLEKSDNRRITLEKRLKAMKTEIKRLQASGKKNYLNYNEKESIDKE